MKKLIHIFKYLIGFFLLLTVLLVAFFYLPIPTSYLADKIGYEADYYFENEETWMKSHNVLEIAYTKLWEFKARKEIVDNVHDRIEEQSSVSAIKFVVNETKNVFINQHQYDIPIIFGSSLSCLVRGFGYCDQVNSGLALLLQDKLDQAHLYNVYTDSNSHTLVKTQSELGTVWVDAYGCVNVFGFPDELSPLGKQEINFYPTTKKRFVFPEKAYRDGTFFNAFTFKHSLNKGVGRFRKLITAKTYKPDQIIVMERNDSLSSKEMQIMQSYLNTAIMTENPEAKSAYLTARVYHLSGEYEKAIFFYKIVKEKTAAGVLGKYADSFINRLEGKEVLCPN